MPSGKIAIVAAAFVACVVLGLSGLRFRPVPHAGRAAPPKSAEDRAAANPVAGLDVNPPRVSLKVTSSQPVELPFTLTNRGPDDLVLGVVQTTCVCTTPQPFAKPRLSPGESTSLNLQVTPVTSSSGNVLIGIPYTTGGVDGTATIPIALIAEPSADPYIVQQPEELRLQQFVAGVGRRDFTIRASEPADAPPWLTGLETSVEGFTARILEQSVVQPQAMNHILREYRCELSGPSPPAVGQTVSGKLRIVVSGDFGPQPNSIFFDWNHGRLLQAFPESLQFESHSDAAQRDVVIFWNNPDVEPDWGQYKVGSLPENVAVEWLESPADRQRMLRIRCPTGVSRDFVVTLQRLDSGAEVLTIPISMASPNRDQAKWQDE